VKRELASGTPDKKYSDFLINNFFKNKQPGFFIEAGAFDGYIDSVCWHLEKDHGWSGMNVECNPHCFADIKKNRPNCININKALSYKEGELPFTWAMGGANPLQGQQGSVIFYSLNPERWDKGKVRPLKNIVVKAVSLRKLLIEHNIKTVDLLVLDIEGYELSALAGLAGSKVMPAVMAIEDDWCDINKLDIVMEKLGYERFHKRYRNNVVYQRIKGK